VRWGWRETALTAAVLIALFLGAGFLLAGNEGWQPERIVVRSGHLIILSLLLIWFGIHQNFSRLFFQAEDIDADLEQDPNPLARALGLARDVHDSIVQFLAGAAFRVEAIKRSAASGNVSQELDELKRLLVEEQGEIRGFLLALRRERELDLAEAVAELKLLAERLGQQWAVDCHVTATEGASSIPIRLQLDLQQMLREAVANAVRHGGANRVDVDLAVDKGHVQLSVVDNGTGFAVAAGKKPKEPWSLKERVERAHGSLNLVTAPGSTNIVISLPLAGAAA
jgi:signal transduction histidine kinase